MRLSISAVDVTSIDRSAVGDWRRACAAALFIAALLGLELTLHRLSILALLNEHWSGCVEGG